MEREEDLLNNLDRIGDILEEIKDNLIQLNAEGIYVTLKKEKE